MNTDLKKQIDDKMEDIASRKPGKKRLVYNKSLRAVFAVDQKGNKTKVISMPTEETWI